jgi:hypothetical protein
MRDERKRWHAPRCAYSATPDPKLSPAVYALCQRRCTRMCTKHGANCLVLVPLAAPLQPAHTPQSLIISCGVGWLRPWPALARRFESSARFISSTFTSASTRSTTIIATRGGEEEEGKEEQGGSSSSSCLARRARRPRRRCTSPRSGLQRAILVAVVTQRTFSGMTPCTIDTWWGGSSAGVLSRR